MKFNTLKVSGNEPNKEAKESNDSTGIIISTNNPVSSSSKNEFIVSENEIKSEESADDSLNSSYQSSHIGRKRIMKRALQIPMKSIDPAQCTDILDDMYDIYFDIEVKEF